MHVYNHINLNSLVVYAVSDQIYVLTSFLWHWCLTKVINIEWNILDKRIWKTYVFLFANLFYIIIILMVGVGSCMWSILIILIIFVFITHLLPSVWENHSCRALLWLLFTECRKKYLICHWKKTNPMRALSTQQLHTQAKNARSSVNTRTGQLCSRVCTTACFFLTEMENSAWGKCLI